MEAILPFATVLGPIVLLAVIVYAWARNRKTRNSVDRKAERKQLVEQAKALRLTVKPHLTAAVQGHAPLPRPQEKL